MDQRLALDLEDVEEHERERPRPLLEEREARAPVVVERRDLSVHDGVRRPEPSLGGSSGFPEALREVVPPPARQLRLAAGHDDDRAVPVPLRLVRPVASLGKRLGRGRGHRHVPAVRAVPRAVLAEDEPVLLLPVQVSRNERPHAVEPLAVEPDGQAAVPLLLEELVRSAVPDLHRAGAVLARRDLALEVAVLERMVLHVHREVALSAPERDSLRHSPARERAVPLEPEVVVEATRVMPLDHEPRRSPFFRLLPNGSGVFPGRRLRRYSSRLTCGLSPPAQRFLHGCDSDPTSSLLRGVSIRGIILWNLWIVRFWPRRARSSCRRVTNSRLRRRARPSGGISHAVRAAGPRDRARRSPRAPR